MASMNEKYDTALIGILQNEGQIAKFLDVLLGFLYRRFVSICLFRFWLNSILRSVLMLLTSHPWPCILEPTAT